MNVNLQQQNVGDTTYLVWDIANANLRVDSFAIKMMSYNHIVNMIPTQVVQMDDRRQAQFNITDLTKLNSKVASVMQKKEVLTLFNSILNAFDEMEAYMLDAEHILLDWDYVYVDRQENCLFLYLPFDKVSGRDKIDFLHEVVSRIKPDAQEQDHYLYDILNAFSRGAVHTIADFRELIKKSAGTAQVRQRDKQRAELTGIPPVQVQTVKSEVSDKDVKATPLKRSSANSRIPVMNIPGREKSVKMAVKEPEKKKKNPFSFSMPRKPKMQSEETIQEQNKTDDDGFLQERQNTDISGNEMYERYEDTVITPVYKGAQGSVEGMVFLENPTAQLLRKKGKTAYAIEGNSVTIGSGVGADICVDFNNTISRNHALICCFNGQYYLEDNQSRNGTFINGMRLQAGKQEPIYNGATIRLSNEEFEFVIE